jgi:hypothetical protein
MGEKYHIKVVIYTKKKGSPQKKRNLLAEEKVSFGVS